MAIAAMCLGLVFARLAGVKPATGGPYAYSRMVFGPFAGFLVAWAYWISIWASLPAIAMVFAGYLCVFFPNLQHVPGGFTVVSLAAMWLVALINMFGVKSAGRFQVVTDGLKLVPFIAIALLGLFWSREPDTRQSERPLPAWPHFRIRAADDVCLFRHRIGDGTARRCRRPEADDPAGDDPRHALLRADLHPGYAGGDGHRATRNAVLSSIGALNGWTLPMAQVPMAAAHDGLFPPVFDRLSSRGVPQRGIIVSMLLASALLVLQTSGVSGLRAVYRFAVDLSTTAAMVPYVFCILVEGALFLTLMRPRTTNGPASASAPIGPMRSSPSSFPFGQSTAADLKRASGACCCSWHCPYTCRLRRGSRPRTDRQKYPPCT